MLKRSLFVLLLAAFAFSSVPVSAAQPHDTNNRKVVQHRKAKVNAKKKKQDAKPTTTKVVKVKKKVVTKPEAKKG